MTSPVMADGVAVCFSRENPAGTRPATGYLKLQVNSDGIDGLAGENIEVDRDQVLDPNLTQERGEVIGYQVKPTLKGDLTDDWLDIFRELILRTATKHSGGTGQSEFRPTAVTAGSPASWTVPALGALPAGTLVRYFNPIAAANGGLHVVAAGSDATHVKTADALVAEVIPANSNVLLCVAGVQGAAADITIDVNGNILSTILDFTTLGLNPGQLCYLGDPTSGAAFTPPLSGAGYFIVGAVAAHQITVVNPTYVVGVDAAAGKTVRILYKSMNTNVPLDPTGANGFLMEPTGTFELSEPGVGGSTEFTENGRVGVNKVTLNIPAESKVEVTLEMMGCTRTDPTTVRGAGCANAIAPSRTGIYTTAAKVLGLRLLKQSDKSAINCEVNAATITFDNKASYNPALGRAGAAFVSFGGYLPSLQFSNVYVHDNDLTRDANQNVDVVADMLMKSETGGFGLYFPMTKIRKPKKAYKKGTNVTLNLDVRPNRDPATGILYSLSQFAYLP